MSPQIYWSLLAMAFVSGALMPLQAGINGLLAKEVSSVLNAATVSFIVGTLALLALALFQRDTVSIESLKGLHWWHWAGGLLGAFFCIYRSLCRATHWCFIVYGLSPARSTQQRCFLDHQGWVGYKEIPINFGKIAGLLLILVGIWVVRRS